MTLLSILDTITFIRLRVIFEAINPIVLPRYKGSAFRGCLGEALREEVCSHQGLKCERCKEKYSCPFSQLYNSYVSPEHPHQRKYPKSPHPYIIDPMFDDQKDFDAGTIFGFDLTLVGSAYVHLPLLHRVFQRMGETGIGKGRGQFKPVSLQKLSADMKYVPLPCFGQPDSLSLAKLPVQAVENRITISLDNPLRLKEDGKLLLSPPPFDFLMERLALRIGLLSHFYCGSSWFEPEWVSQNQVKDIQICEANLHIVDWRRYSGTQDSTMQFDGLVGRITYEGDGLNDWMPLITLGSWLHVGSTATFGLGKYSIIDG